MDCRTHGRRAGRATTTLHVLALTGAVFGLAATTAAPAHADMMGNAFLTALNNAGIPSNQPAGTIALGRTVCPMLFEPGGNFDTISSKVAAYTGMPLDKAGSFTIIAIATYCPAVILPLLPHRLQA